MNLDLPWGKTLGIVGLTGSGKTTLLRLLLRHYDAPDGTILIDGKGIRSLPLAELRSLVRVVPQETFLFSGPVRENILFGTDAVDEETLRRVAEQAGILAEIDEMPEGFDTLIGERGITLSGGQRQRVAIARALVLNPRILILDDCLSAVDSQTERHILDRLREIWSGSTALVVSNRIAAVMHCDEIIVLDDGAVLERGHHSELVASDGLYADLNRRQELEEWIEKQ